MLSLLIMAKESKQTREEILQYHKDYYQANKEKIKEQIKKTEQKFCEYCKCHVKKYYNHTQSKKHINNYALVICVAK